MAFVPNTDSQRKEMLDKIGVQSFDELIAVIPDDVKFKGELNMPPKLSEYEVTRLMENYAAKNKTANTHICFLGGGAYDHFVPTVVNSVLERPEFKTAYTPYQAEVSQGTLQAMYEFQSMITALTGMDIANASMYDGGSALGEACLLSHAQTKKTHFLVAGALNPHYRYVMETMSLGRGYTFENIENDEGMCDMAALEAKINDDVAGVILQQPNPYGNIEDAKAIGEIAHRGKKAQFIVMVDPISLGILEAPGNYGADIVVGEGQSLGIPLNFGGPYVGLFAVTKKLLRKIPGRLSGVTVDTDGNRGFVLTLQTREQQIKREKATSNICTNQGLMMLASTVYMATMGRQGIKEVAEQSFQRAHYLASGIQSIPGFKLLNEKPFFKEFLVIPPVPVNDILDAAENEGILAGLNTARFPECKQGLLVAVTEKRSKEEMDKYIEFLKRFAK